MIYLVIASIALAIVGCFGMRYSLDRYTGLGLATGIAGFIACFAGGIGLIAVILCGVSWQGAKVQAQLINREYGSNYTQEEVFYASESIDIIRELDRKRIEVNGDFRRERDPQRDKYQRKEGDR